MAFPEGHGDGVYQRAATYALVSAGQELHRATYRRPWVMAGVDALLSLARNGEAFGTGHPIAAHFLSVDELISTFIEGALCARATGSEEPREIARAVARAEGWIK